MYLVALIGLSVQLETNWQHLLDLSEDDAHSYLHSDLATMQPSAPQLRTGIPAAPEPDHILQIDPHAQASQPTGPSHHELAPQDPGFPLPAAQLLLPPRTLTLAERFDMLNEAASEISFSHYKPILIHPFIGFEIPQQLLDEFVASQAWFREYKPGFLLQGRATNTHAWNGEGVSRLDRPRYCHLFVWKYSVVGDLPLAETVLQFVGVIERNRRSLNDVKHFPAYRTARTRVERLGPDTLVDHSPLFPVQTLRDS